MKQQECAKQRHHNNKLGLKRKDRFELVKTLQRTGVPNAQIADITGLTKSTVSTMGKHETYDAYAAECREQSARSLARQAQQPQLTLDTPATTNAEQYAELLADIEHIMQRLEWLEVQIPRRKGLFS